MKRTELAAKVLAQLHLDITAPETELHYSNPYELLVAVLLSAQCTDARVNMHTPAFFEVYPDPKTLAKADFDTVYDLIKSITFPNNKAKSLLKLGPMLMDDFAGEIPKTVKELVTLPGVGNKTAQVVVSVAFGVPALPVDTHVFRVSNRIGLSVKAPTVLDVEKQLKRAIPKEEWGTAHHLIILHGRYTCKAQKPNCEACNLTELCHYYSQLQKLPAGKTGLSAKKGKFYCASCKKYQANHVIHTDRIGVDQPACNSCGSMNLFVSKTGKTTKKAKDYRV